MNDRLTGSRFNFVVQPCRRSWQWRLVKKRIVLQLSNADRSDGHRLGDVRILLDGGKIERLNVGAAVAAVTAAAVVIHPGVLQPEDLGVIPAARFPVIDRDLAEAFLDAVIDDVLHGDGRGWSDLVLITISSAMNPPLVLLKMGFLAELVSALAALERPLLVVVARLVLLQCRLVCEDDATANALERISDRWRSGIRRICRRRPGRMNLEVSKIFRNRFELVIKVFFDGFFVAFVLLLLLVGELHLEFDRLRAGASHGGFRRFFSGL